MSKKHTIKFVREQFEREDYTLLTKKYINCGQKLDYICPKRHKGSICWDCWQRGIRCAECAGVKKLTIKFIREQFEKEDYTLLTKEYVNNKQKLEYICPNKHLGRISWHNWQQGYRCFECFGKKKHTIEFVRSEFEKGGYTLLSKKYVNNKTHLDFICPNGHFWHISWSKWQRGARCQKCFFENNKGENNPMFGKDFSGENNPHWNPNLTEKDREKRYKIPGYTEWAYAVKERDNFTCQVCGDSKGGNLVSHHLESYSSNPDLRIALDNGICLCEKCHKDFHHQYSWGNNTREQFSEFLCAQKILLETLGDINEKICLNTK